MSEITVELLHIMFDPDPQITHHFTGKILRRDAHRLGVAIATFGTETLPLIKDAYAVCALGSS